MKQEVEQCYRRYVCITRTFCSIVRVHNTLGTGEHHWKSRKTSQTLHGIEHFVNGAIIWYIYICKCHRYLKLQNCNYNGVFERNNYEKYIKNGYGNSKNRNIIIQRDNKLLLLYIQYCLSLNSILHVSYGVPKLENLVGITVNRSILSWNTGFHQTMINIITFITF